MINSPFLYIAIFISIIAESFPISSSSHVYLICAWLERLFLVSVDMQFLQNIELLTHGCYVLVLAWFFRVSWWVYIKSFPRSLYLWLNSIVQGFIVECVTVFFYIVFYKHAHPQVYIAYGLFITAFLLYSLKYVSHNKKSISWNSNKQSIVLGIAQGMAFFPGISRFASTFVAARWLGLNARRSFETSFLIAIPINCAAFFLGLVNMNIYAYHYSCSLFVSMICASFFMYGGLLLVKSLIYKDKLWYFSIYVFFLACMLLISRVA